MTKLQWLWRQTVTQLWVRVAGFGAIAVIVALFSAFVPFPVDEGLAEKISTKIVDNILSLLAASMLTVTTFSLGVMLTAYGASANAASPRATQLVIADDTTQNVLSVFIGAFIFALVGLIALSWGAYGPSGRVILFVVSMVVVVAIVFALIRWTQHLSHIGRLSNTLDKVERAARQSIEMRLEEPYLCGAARGRGEPPADAFKVFAGKVGNVQFIDVEALDKLARETDAQVFVNVSPGDFVDPTQAIADVAGPRGEARDADWGEHILIAPTRTFTQDPRFGATVLAEIASRALSPAVNDPGTAIDILGRGLRVLSLWRPREKSDPPRFPRVHVPALSVDDLFEDFFRPIARDGAALVEVQLRLQRVLRALHDGGDARVRDAARRSARDALDRARDSLGARDLKEVERAASWSR